MYIRFLAKDNEKSLHFKKVPDFICYSFIFTIPPQKEYCLHIFFHGVEMRLHCLLGDEYFSDLQSLLHRPNVASIYRYFHREITDERYFLVLHVPNPNIYSDENSSFPFYTICKKWTWFWQILSKSHDFLEQTALRSLPRTSTSLISSGLGFVDSYHTHLPTSINNIISKPLLWVALFYLKM